MRGGPRPPTHSAKTPRRQRAEGRIPASRHTVKVLARAARKSPASSGECLGVEVRGPKGSEVPWLEPCQSQVFNGISVEYIASSLCMRVKQLAQRNESLGVNRQSLSLMNILVIVHAPRTMSSSGTLKASTWHATLIASKAPTVQHDVNVDYCPGGWDMASYTPRPFRAWVGLFVCPCNAAIAARSPALMGTGFLTTMRVTPSVHGGCESEPAYVT
jgi:hypothetical protein